MSTGESIAKKVAEELKPEINNIYVVNADIRNLLVEFVAALEKNTAALQKIEQITSINNNNVKKPVVSKKTVTPAVSTKKKVEAPVKPEESDESEESESSEESDESEESDNLYSKFIHYLNNSELPYFNNIKILVNKKVERLDKKDNVAYSEMLKPDEWNKLYFDDYIIQYKNELSNLKNVKFKNVSPPAIKLSNLSKKFKGNNE